MQLTNFLRDIREDYEDLDRIYMPCEILQSYGLDHNIIIQYCKQHSTNHEESWKLFMQQLIGECRILYRESLE